MSQYMSHLVNKTTDFVIFEAASRQGILDEDHAYHHPCALCLANEEDLQQLLFECSYTSQG